MKTKNHLTFLTLVLLCSLIINYVSAIIYALIPDEKWFSRFALAMVCTGFYVIIKKMDE
jgi:hypothetical protein